jgi:hypothetical protein
MADDLIRVMYISRARRRMTNGELADLLAGARLRNQEHGITGLLIFDAGYFAQVLEGPTASIESLLANITDDPRHDEYMLVSSGPVEERYFDGWSMDWAQIDLQDDSRHAQLRLYLRNHTIADRSAIFGALAAFVSEHRNARS